MHDNGKSLLASIEIGGKVCAKLLMSVQKRIPMGEASRITEPFYADGYFFAGCDSSITAQIESTVSILS